MVKVSGVIKIFLPLFFVFTFISDFVAHHRSVSLIGESERRMLKDIIKQSKTAVKSRTVPHGRMQPLYTILTRCVVEGNGLLGYGFLKIIVTFMHISGVKFGLLRQLVDCKPIYMFFIWLQSNICIHGNNYVDGQPS